MAGVLSTVQSADEARAARLWLLVVNVGTPVLRHTFDSHIPPNELQNKLNDPNTRKTLNDLRRKVIFKKEWDRLYPLGSNTPDSKDFDITLLSVLLRNLCNLDKTSPFWKDAIPPSFDKSVVADISRIRGMKNEFSHMKRAALKKEEFEEKWKEIEQAILRLGTGIPDLAENIEKRKNRAIDPEHAAQYFKETEVNCRGVKSKMTNIITNGDENASMIKIQREDLNDLKENRETGQSIIGSLDIRKRRGNMNPYEDIFKRRGNMNPYEDIFKRIGNMNPYEDIFKRIGNMNPYEDIFKRIGNMNPYEESEKDLEESEKELEVYIKGRKEHRKRLEVYIKGRKESEKELEENRKRLEACLRLI